MLLVTCSDVSLIIHCRYHADNEAVSLADLRNATKIITNVIGTLNE
jgi:hypothetical protein